MQTRVVWNEKMKFVGESSTHKVELDAKPPFGVDSAMTPKELLTISIAGCTGMDIVGLMKKYKQPLESFEVKVEASSVDGTMPVVFKEIALTFVLKGNLDKEKVIEAVHLSQSKFCSVSAMVVKAVPIHYRINLNGEEIAKGEASFKKQEN